MECEREQPDVGRSSGGDAKSLTPSTRSMSLPVATSSAIDSRNSGAIVKVVTKSGTNNFHGSGWFQYQDPNFNAYNKYGGPVQGEKPVRVDNNWKLFWRLGWRTHQEGQALLLCLVFGPAQHRRQRSLLRPGLRRRNIVRRSTTCTRVLSPIRLVNQPGIAPRVNTVLTPSCSIFTNAGWPCQVVGGGIDVGSPTGVQGSYVPVFSGDQAGGGLDGIPDLEYVQLKQPNSANPNQYTGRLDYVAGKQQFPR